MVMKRERKTRTTSIVARPSTIEKMFKILRLRDDSFNSFINRYLDKYVEEHEDEVRQYDAKYSNQ